MKTDLMTWVATAIGCPLAIVSVCWTLIIYHYHRRQWHSTDFLLATIVVQGIIKQVATFFYTLLTLLQPIEYEQTLCSTLTWIMNSIHVLQAGTLATFILTRLLAIKFPQKYVHAVRRTHLIYHIVSLSILASCIGVAAILAEKKPPVNLFQNINSTFPFLDDKGRRAHCAFLPHELEERYAILSIVIHSFLILSSIVILLLACFSWCVYNKSRDETSYKQRQLLLTSSSDLSAMSDLSLGSTAQNMGLISSRKENGGSVISITRLLNTENGGVPASRGRNDTLIHELPRHSTSFTNHSNAYNDQRKCSRHDHTYSGNSNVFQPSFSSSNSNPFMLHSTSLHRYKNTSVNNDNHPTNGSNYDEIYDQTFLRSGNYTNGDSCRWTTESSYMSTSTSSTNSRAPCLIRPVHPEGNTNVGLSEEPRLAIAVSVLVLCYIFNHIPSLALSIVATFLPSLVPLSWPLTLMYLWGGLAEESLLPVILAIFDNNFSGWVASVYSRDHKIFADIAAHNQGLDGKFRVFSSPLLDAQPPHHKPSTQQEHAKFPITNGSLFTTVDGRHPVIHKYRTRKGTRTPVPHILPQFTSVELTESHLQGNKALQEFLLHNFSDSIHHHPGFMRKNLKDSKQTITIEPEFNSLRPSLSSEHDVGRNIDIPLLDDLHIDMPNQSLGCKGDLNSELKEYDEENEPIYATLSSHSCCSATTAANDDFDFYQHETNDIPKLRKSKVNHTTKLDMHSNSFQLDDKYHSPESQVCKDPIESANTAILHKCEILNNEISLSQSCKIDSSSQMCGVCNKYNDLVDIIVPVIQELHGKNDRDDHMLKQELENTAHESSSFSEEILKTVIEKELKKNKAIKINIGEKNIMSHENTPIHSSISYSPKRRETIIDQPRHETKPLGNTSQDNKKCNEKISRCQEFKFENKNSNLNSHCTTPSGFLNLSLSMNNLDGLTEPFHRETTNQQPNGRRNGCSESPKQYHDTDLFGIESKEIVFELPVKSESTLSLYHLHLNDDVNGDNIQSDQIIEKDQNHRFYKQSSVISRPWGQIMPHSQRMGRQTPPMPRMLKQKKTLPVLSMESLNSALNTTGDSYLDNGDLCHHNRDHCGSVPDFRRVFVSDFI